MKSKTGVSGNASKTDPTDPIGKRAKVDCEFVFAVFFYEGQGCSQDFPSEQVIVFIEKCSHF